MIALTLSIGVALQAWALRTLFESHAPKLAALLNLLGALVAAIGLRRLGRRRGEGSHLSDLSLGALLSFFLPWLGPLGLGGVLLLRRRTDRGAKRTPPRITGIPSLPARPLLAEHRSHFGPGALAGLLRRSPDPEARVRVVMACRRLAGRLSVPLLRTALRDPVDDVRLLAYAVLDGRERNLFAEIDLVTRQLREVTEEAGGRLHERLALLHWELAYQDLVQGESLIFGLEQTLHHANEAARREGAHAAPLFFLMGRVHLRLADPAAAQKALAAAQVAGFPSDLLVPYLAEVAFLLRRPKEIRRLMASLSPEARRRGNLSPLVAQWS